MPDAPLDARYPIPSYLVRLIFTDLDGTLIDHHTYSAEAARPALEAARAAGVPVVPCSSKTLAEMRLLADVGASSSDPEEMSARGMRLETRRGSSPNERNRAMARAL